jgi:hypothetical protein
MFISSLIPDSRDDKAPVRISRATDDDGIALGKVLASFANGPQPTLPVDASSSPSRTDYM